MALIVKLTALVRIDKDGFAALAPLRYGDVALAAAGVVLRDLPDGMTYVERTAVIHGFDDSEEVIKLSAVDQRVFAEAVIEAERKGDA